MFCKNCGEEMRETAQFCTKCGYDRINGEPCLNKVKIVEDNKIRYQLKPEFVIPYKIIIILCRMTAIAFIFLYIFGIYLIKYPVIIFIAIGIMIVYIVIKLMFEKMQYENLEYNFYATKIEYKDGYLNKEEKELKYKYIREVAMSQSILERLFQIGTIMIYTNASSAYGNVSNHGSMMGRNGIYIHCVENVQEQYAKIRQIIDEGTQEE